MMKKVISIVTVCVFALALLFDNAGLSVNRIIHAAEDTNDDKQITQFMDCFLPTPIISEDGLSTTCWGAASVGARDQGNGLEDKDLQVRNADDPEHDYVYWDGGIIRDDETGTYYMFASRWDATTGSHYEWNQSVAVYATSDNLYGPYEDKGLLWPDNNKGKGHNVYPLKLKEGDASGYKYAVVVSDTRPTDIFLSKSLDGPWVYGTSIQKQIDEELQELGFDINGATDDLGRQKTRFNGKNTCIILRHDGKYEAFTRDGDIAVSDNIMGPWTLASSWTTEPEDKNLWDVVPGMRAVKMEDPVIWYSDGLYHCVVNQWDTKYAIYLSSENGIDDWKVYPGMAYMPQKDFIRYTDGTVNHWDKLERPNVYIEDGLVKAMLFAAEDVPKHEDKANDNHGSKIIIVNFDGAALSEYSKRPDSAFNRTMDGDDAIADTNSQSWLDRNGDTSKDEWHKNYGGRNYMYIHGNNDKSLGAFSEKANEGETRKAQDAKIGYIKFDISKYNLQEIENATLSLVFMGQSAGNENMNSIRIALTDSDWTEGTGNDDLAGDGSLTWDNQPKINYDPDNLSGTTVESDAFSTEFAPKQINVDVTKLVKMLEAGETILSFALTETKGGQRLSIASREMGSGCEPKLIIKGGVSHDPEEPPVPTPTCPANTPAAGPHPVNTPDVNKFPKEGAVPKADDGAINPITVKTSMILGAGQKYSVKLLNIKGAKVSCHSSNKKIASVNKKGLVKTKKAGKANITININNGKHTVKYVIGLKVKKGVTANNNTVKYKTKAKTPSIALYKELKRGDAWNVSVEDRDKTAIISFETSNKKVAAVSKKGKITAKTAGKAIITVSVRQKGERYCYYMAVRVKGGKK